MSIRNNMKLCLIAAAAILLMGIVSQAVNDAIPKAYMDEPFHAAQTHAYCRGEWDHWDEKLTPLPGLFALSALPHHAVARAAGISPSSPVALSITCNLAFLRAQNLLYGAGSLLIAMCLGGSLAGAALFLWPVHFFYLFLFYTDAGSLFFSLLALHRAYHLHMGQSALSGAAAVLFRQTNIVWVCFAFAYSWLVHHPHSSRWWLPSRAMFSHFAPIFPVSAAFVAFVLMNGAIVLGDHTHHVAAIHLPQMLYLSGALALSFGPDLLAMAISDVRNGRLGGLAMHAIGALAVGGPIAWAIAQYFSIAHPFILSDNRHYTFYLWKDILSHAPLRIALFPMLALASVLLYRLLRAHYVPRAAILLYVFSSAAVLVPAPLIEPRYFMLPVAMFHILLHARADPYPAVTLVRVLLYLVVNALTLWVFLYHPYEWVDGTTAHRMW